MLYFDANKISLPASISLCFNPKDDACDTYLKFIEKKFQENNINSIEEYAKRLNNSRKNNIDRRKLVEAEDYIKLKYDNEEDVEIFCIKGAVPIFKPKWNGIRSQSTKNNYTTEYQKTNVAAGEIADNSPLARAILGKAEGENFAFTIDKIKTSGKILQILKRYD